MYVRKNAKSFFIRSWVLLDRVKTKLLEICSEPVKYINNFSNVFIVDGRYTGGYGKDGMKLSFVQLKRFLYEN